MKLLTVLCFLSGLAAGSSNPGFRYAYMIPQENYEQPWSQFNERTNTHSAWGYEFPGRVHFESRDDKGVVKGTFGYVDANGNPIVWKYRSDPISGFNVQIGTGETLTAAQAETSKNEDAKIKQDISPQLQQAIVYMKVVPAGISPSGFIQFVVHPDIAKEAGSVSSLAALLGVIPVAARHDTRGRPTLLQDPDYSPVLVPREEPDFTLYTLEV
ncbi:hypothetical protein SK128_017269 [Halocaridina rubra]|uniref:Uncharacterized protein n=1 Tax=Halocaridina rubra TaxID=373956 RepID=A0AAN8WJA6_HALRR